MSGLWCQASAGSNRFSYFGCVTLDGDFSRPHLPHVKQLSTHSFSEDLSLVTLLFVGDTYNDDGLFFCTACIPVCLGEKRGNKQRVRIKSNSWGPMLQQSGLSIPCGMCFVSGYLTSNSAPYQSV